MIRILAKPSIRDARYEAKKHGVSELSAVSAGVCGVYFDAPDTPDNRHAFMKWFVDCIHNPPFPPGTCLYYTWPD